MKTSKFIQAFLLISMGISAASNANTTQNNQIPRGEEKQLCISEKTPDGWEEIGTVTSSHCAEQESEVNNTKIIARVEAQNTLSGTNIHRKTIASSCTLSADKFYVGFGEEMRFTVTGVNIPPGSGYYWHGTRNSIQDSFGEYGGTAPGSHAVLNTNSTGATEYYRRYAVIKDPQQNVLCVTNTLSIDMTSGSCNLEASSTDVPRGAMMYFYVRGNNLPPGSQYYWYGSNNGTPGPFGDHGGNAPGEYMVINNGAGSYIRYAQLRNNQGKIYCTTNPVSVRFH